MPELPDLEIIREVLIPRLVRQTITEVEIVRPLVVRDLTGEDFGSAGVWAGSTPGPTVTVRCDSMPEPTLPGPSRAPFPRPPT